MSPKDRGDGYGSWFRVHGSSTSEATESSAWLMVHGYDAR